jgi:hypothetical protein
MPERLKMEYQNFKSDAKGPIWQFSGLFLIICLIGFSGYSSSKDKENTAKYLSEPVIGDIYEYRIETGSYSTMKVMQVTTDILFVSLNDYEISKSSRMYKIDKAENYSDEIYGISRKEIQAMKVNGNIVGINRD